MIDAPRRLAFVTCEGNATLHVLDLRHMRFTGASTVGATPDVLAFDPGLRRLYVAAESGEVAVFAETAHGVSKLGQALLAPSAPSVAVDPRTHPRLLPARARHRRLPAAADHEAALATYERLFRLS